MQMLTKYSLFLRDHTSWSILRSPRAASPGLCKPAGFFSYVEESRGRRGGNSFRECMLCYDVTLWCRKMQWWVLLPRLPSSDKYRNLAKSVSRHVVPVSTDFAHGRYLRWTVLVTDSNWCFVVENPWEAFQAEETGLRARNSTVK